MKNIQTANEALLNDENSDVLLETLERVIKTIDNYIATFSKIANDKKSLIINDENYDIDNQINKIDYNNAFGIVFRLNKYKYNILRKLLPSKILNYKDDNYQKSYIIVYDINGNEYFSILSSLSLFNIKTDIHKLFIYNKLDSGNYMVSYEEANSVYNFDSEENTVDSSYIDLQFDKDFNNYVCYSAITNLAETDDLITRLNYIIKMENLGYFGSGESVNYSNIDALYNKQSLKK